MIKIGVIGVQGAVSEHITMLNHVLGSRGEAVWLRKSEAVDGIVIPGGESTTITALMKKTGLWDFVKTEAKKGTPIMGTCAGLIVLCKEGVDDSVVDGQSFLGLLDARVNRNAFGGQRESFESDVDLSFLDSSFRGVFIRAPAVEQVFNGARVVAKYDNRVIALEDENILGLSFHPELTNDTRVHEYFVNKIK